MQHGRRRRNEGQVVVEQTLLVGLLLIGVAIAISVFVSPAFSLAMNPFSGRLGRVGPVVAYAPRSGGRRAIRPISYEKSRANLIVVLTAEQREELREVADRGAAPGRADARARALLMAADGESSGDIARQLGVSEPLVREWLWKAVARPVMCRGRGDDAVCRGHLPVPARARRAVPRVTQEVRVASVARTAR